MEYSRVSEYEREPFVEYSTHRPMMGNYHPNERREFTTEKVVYEEDVIGRPGHHHMHRHHPETREMVKVVEYEVPERRMSEVIYEENKVAYATNPYLPRY